MLNQTSKIKAAPDRIVFYLRVINQVCPLIYASINTYLYVSNRHGSKAITAKRGPNSQQPGRARGGIKIGPRLKGRRGNCVLVPTSGLELVIQTEKLIPGLLLSQLVISAFRLNGCQGDNIKLILILFYISTFMDLIILIDRLTVKC